MFSHSQNLNHQNINQEPPYYQQFNPYWPNNDVTRVTPSFNAPNYVQYPHPISHQINLYQRHDSASINGLNFVPKQIFDPLFDEFCRTRQTPISHQIQNNLHPVTAPNNGPNYVPMMMHDPIVAEFYNMKKRGIIKEAYSDGKNDKLLTISSLTETTTKISRDDTKCKQDKKEKEAYRKVMQKFSYKIPRMRCIKWKFGRKKQIKFVKANESKPKEPITAEKVTSDEKKEITDPSSSAENKIVQVIHVAENWNSDEACDLKYDDDELNIASTPQLDALQASIIEIRSIFQENIDKFILSRLRAKKSKLTNNIEPKFESIIVKKIMAYKALLCHSIQRRQRPKRKKIRLFSCCDNLMKNNYLNVFVDKSHKTL